MSLGNALIVFVKNPVLGKVKTRLSQTIGPKKALKVYQHLLAITRETIEDLDSCDKFIFYDEYIPAKDEWNTQVYEKRLQEGKDIFEKLSNAFNTVFKEDYDKAIMIMTDCPKLRPIFIENAFKKLDHTDVVIGPTNDGGIYLLGMKKLYPNILTHKNWGSGTIFADTLEDMEKSNISYFTFPQLVDVDYETDLGDLKKLLDDERNHEIDIPEL